MRHDAYSSSLLVVLCLFAPPLLLLLQQVEAGVPLKRFENLVLPQSQELGLYNASDRVVVLTDVNFKATVLQQSQRSSLVEFYNSYCGHCKRFAPTYKKLAAELYAWRDFLTVGAIDCAAEQNNDICREYEVMAYPTLRYFGLNYLPSADNYGKRLDTQDLSAIHSALVQWMVAENRSSSNSSVNWPNFENLTEQETANLFATLDARQEYVLLVYEPDNSTVGIETILNFQRYPAVTVRRITDAELAAKYQLDGTRYKLALVDRKLSVTPYSTLADTAQSYRETIESVLHTLHVSDGSDTVTANSTNSNVTMPNYVMLLKEEQGLAEKQMQLLQQVRNEKHVVYQADLELAIRTTLLNEIPKVAHIEGERLLALQRYLAVLQRYNPLGQNGRTLVSKLYEFVMQHNQELKGKDFSVETLRLMGEHQHVFSAKHYVGCMASKQGLRGFTCSLWQLFHYMSVQAALGEQSQDPLELLQSMHGYVKYFFGCSECSEHFQAMASHRKIWSTPNKDEAILWLWAAHNQVNQRLAGDTTEDPDFPKIQFPSQNSCSQCYKHAVASPASLDINWDKDEVLTFLKDIHHPANISRLGVTYESILQPTLDKLRQKRMIGNIFSDMDMRMGLFLYGFCILMLVVAFKLFVFKGYRKKPYSHDLLGKV